MRKSSIGNPEEPPWPKPKPYTANIFKRLFRVRNSWLGFLNEWDFRIKLGELNILGLPVFLVNDANLVRRVLVDEVDDFPKHPYTLWILEPLIGRAIFSVNGEEWAFQRRLIDQAFQIANLKRVFPSMSLATESLLKRIKKNNNLSFLNIDKEITLVTADVIIRTILSRELQQEEANNIFQAFSRYQKNAGRALIFRFLKLPKKLIQSTLNKDALLIRTWIQKIISNRLEEYKNRKEKFIPPRDLLDSLIQAKDHKTNKSFSERELIDQVCFLFLAGHETSASSLGMTLWLIAFDSRVQNLMRKEVDSVAGERGPNEMLGVEDIRKLQYCRAVFNETLRLYPPVTFFIRSRSKSNTNFEVDKQKSRCPLGALLTLSPWVIHRHENHWPEPNKFEPERFLGNNFESLRRNVFLPFGLGPRKCPGASFAQQEAILILAELIRRYKFFPVKNHIPNLIGFLTLRTNNGIYVNLSPRI